MMRGAKPYDIQRLRPIRMMSMNLGFKTYFARFLNQHPFLQRLTHKHSGLLTFGILLDIALRFFVVGFPHAFTCSSSQSIHFVLTLLTFPLKSVVATSTLMKELT